jgi:signal transduction histidine kinase
LAVITLLLSYGIAYHYYSGEPVILYLSLMIVATVLTGATLIWMGLRPAPSLMRLISHTVSDRAIITIIVATHGPWTAFMTFVYIWGDIGNAARHGRRYLYFSMACSLAGMSTIIYVNPNWHSPAVFPVAVGIWLAILLGPAYSAVFFRRLRDADTKLTEIATHDRQAREYSKILESEIQLRTQELANARDLAIEASRHKSEFLATVSHELRTPLQSIIGYAEVVLEDLAKIGQHQMRRDLNIVLQAAEHLQSLITTILDFSRIEAGRIDLSLEWVDLVALGREVISTITPLAQRGGNDVQLRVTAEAIHLRTDRLRLRQIVLNLLSNACKFTKNGHITMWVSASAREVIVSVSDTGKGIAKADHALIFEAFRQVKTDEDHPGGAGLGLAIASRLTKALDGSIEVSSDLGAGATFTVRIPRTDIPAARDYDKTALRRLG